MNICLCGAQSGYPHSPNCPRPLFRATEAQEKAWIHDYEAIKAKQKATQHILDRRAAAGLLDSDTAAAMMDEAQKDIAASADAMQAERDAENLSYLNCFDYDSLPSIDTVFSNSVLVKRWPFCKKSCELRHQAIAKRDSAKTMTEVRHSIASSADAMTQDFSVANDAALFAADQHADWLDWQWSVGDLGL